MTNKAFDLIATADPHCQDPEFLTAIANDAQLAQKVKQAKALEQSLDAIFSQPSVDDDLAQKIIAHTPLTSNTKKPHAMWAIAASFFIAAISFTLWQTSNQLVTNDLSHHALAHTDHGSRFAGLVDEQPSISSINYRLESLGAKFSDQLTDVAWFNDCRFEGINSLHLVFNGAQGLINVFVVPKDHSFVMESQFSNERYQGIAEELNSAYILIVGEKGEQLQPFQQKLTNALSWSI